MTGFTVRPAGACGVYLAFGEAIGHDVARRLLAAARTLQTASLPGIRDIVPGYGSLFVEFDPLRWSADELAAAIGGLPEPDASTFAERPVRIPVCYGGDFGPDLEDVARAARMTGEEAAALHAGRTYDVYFIGFTPGFGFMGEVDPRIALGRLQSPRLAVPAGSVGIAGRQTGVYPVASPGGWRIVGRTPLRLYRPETDAPILLRPGDRVRFEAISPAEFARIAAEEGSI